MRLEKVLFKGIIRGRYQNGSMLVFLAGFILPLLMLLCSVAIDVNGYSTRREEIQNIADAAVLYGVKYLPDINSAETGAADYLKIKAKDATFTLSSSNDELQVRINGNFEPFFAPFFNKILSAPILFPYAAASQARAMPLDVYIAIDRGAELSPDYSTSDDTAWGDSGQWGAAQIFSAVLPINFAEGRMHPRIVTQQCFNPKFSLIKRAAVKTFDFFSGFRMNRVGIGYFPGAVSLYGMSRDINAGIKKAESVEFYDTHPDWDTDHYVTIEEEEPIQTFPVQSSYCASIAETEPFYTQYLLPKPPTYVGIGNQHELLIDQSTWSVNPSYPLSTREKIWSRSVNKNALMDFSVAIGAIEQSLFYSGQNELRGGLVNNAPQVAFIFSDRTPQINNVRFSSGGGIVADQIHNLLADLRAFKDKQKTKLTLYYFMLESSTQEVSELSDLFASETYAASDGTSYFEAKVIRGEESDEFLSKMLTNIFLEQRSHAVSR